MAIKLGQPPLQIDAQLLERVRNVEVPTFGHFLESGFFDYRMRRIAGSGQFAGRAVTVSAPPGDSTLVHYACALLEEGDVLIISTAGDFKHAVMGGFAISALQYARASAVVIDGVCTDIAALQASGIAVYALGTTALTTKMLGLDAGGVNVAVDCAGVRVIPGQLVAGDENGIVCADPAEFAKWIDRAEQSDFDEPEQIRRVLEGEPLHHVSPSKKLLEHLGMDIE